MRWQLSCPLPSKALLEGDTMVAMEMPLRYKNGKW